MVIAMALVVAVVVVVVVVATVRGLEVLKRDRGRRLTLIVVDYIAKMVATAVVSLAHAHAVVREVDIAVIAKDWAEGSVSGETRLHASLGPKGRELTFWHLVLCRG